MPKTDIEAICEAVKSLDSEVRFLRRLIALQRAQIEALIDFTTARIADIGGQDRKATVNHLQKTIRAIYDENILKLEAKFPAMATDIDFRAGLSPQEQALWYLASEEFPKTDASENDESEGQK